MSSTKFQLSCDLRGHEGDVRAVCTHGDEVVTASRDHSVRIWTPRSSAATSYDCTRTLMGHTNFVGAVVSTPFIYNPMSSLSFEVNVIPAPGAIVSGSNDSHIIVWDPLTSSASSILEGHEKTVCSLAVASDGTLLSGSWDHTARIWKNGQCVAILKGHEGAVWAVQILPDGRFITGCADGKIRIFTLPSLEGAASLPLSINPSITVTAHAQSVRGLMLLPESSGGFLASVSNDQTIKLWTLSPSSLECVHTLNGHTSFIYCITVLPTGEIATAGEDKQVRIWKDFESIQTIPLPAIAWSLASLPNGDLVVGNADKVTRIFTRSPARVASEEQLAIYNEVVASQSISAKTLGGGAGSSNVDVAKLPTKEVGLSRPGATDGDIKLVKEGDGACAYQWSKADGKWIKVGDVVGAPSGGEGGEAMDDSEDTLSLGNGGYDNVFEIELPGGRGNRKIYYKNGDNPYETAQKFMWKYDIDQQFLEQIAKFIMDNAPGASASASSAPAYVDPLTGGGRYIPGTGTQPVTRPFSSSAACGGGYAFSTYAKEQLERQKQQQAASVAAAQPVVKHFPKLNPELFTTINAAGVITKLQQFNTEVAATVGSAAALVEAEMVSMESLMDMLKDITRYDASTVNQVQIKIIVNLLQTWPMEKRFPALDMLRMMVMHGTASAYFQAEYEASHSVSSIHRLALTAGGFTAGAPAAPPACQMLALRLFSNMMQRDAMKRILLGHMPEILDAVEGPSSTSPNATVRSTYASLLHNLAAHFSGTPFASPKSKLASTLASSLRTASTAADKDAEYVYKLLVALGTLIENDSTSLKSSLSASALPVLASLAAMYSDVPKVTECIGQLLVALTSA